MAGEGGNIIRNVFGKSYKEAEFITKDASKGALDFKSPEETTFHGKNGGKKFNEYQAKKDETLLVVKVEGPLDDDGKKVEEPKEGVKYWFKAAFNRSASKSEYKKLAWLYKINGMPIPWFVDYSSLSGNTETIQVKIPCHNMRVYAFFKNPIDEVSVDVILKKLEPVIIFVNGYWNVSWLQKDLLGFSDGKALVGYWGNKLKDNVLNYFKSNKENIYFINGADTAFSRGSTRYNNGKEFAEARLKNKQSKFYKAISEDNRDVMIVSHSMGGAFAEGILSILKSQNVNVKKVVHLSPADVSGFSTTYSDRTYQIDISWDPVLTYKNLNDGDYIKGIKYAGLIQNPDHDQYGHANTKLEGYVWDWFEDLERINLTYSRTETKYERLPSDGLGPATTITIKMKIFKSSGTKHNTQFIKIFKNGQIYHHHSNNEYENY